MAPPKETTAEAKARKLQDLANPYRGYKSNLSRVINRAEAAIRTADKSNSSAYLVTQLKSHVDAITGPLESSLDCLLQMQRLALEADAPGYDDKREEETVRADAAINRLMERIAAMEADLQGAQQPPQAAGQGHQPRPKAVDALKPPVLGKDSEPKELSIWVRKFRAFFESSRLELASRVEQQEYFRSCIDTHLDARISHKVEANTPVLKADERQGEKSLERLLEEEFLLKHPVFARRLDFFKSKHQRGETFSEWAQTLRSLGDEASLTHLEVDDMYVMRYLTAIADDELLDRLLKVVEPTREKLDLEVKNYEVAEQYKKAAGLNKVAVNATNQNQNRNSAPNSGGAGGNRQRQNGGNAPNPALRARKDQIRKENLCFRCGEVRPAPNSGKFHTCDPNTLYCDDCKVNGHKTKMCLKKLGQGQPSGQPGGASVNAASTSEPPSYAQAAGGAQGTD